VKFYTELNTAASQAHIHTKAADFLALAKSGQLPRMVYAWAPAGADEHPPQKSDPQYIERGQQAVWDRVHAVVQAGEWANTVFILTWDDWGGYADHLATPDSEREADALHPAGFQIIGGARIPLIMFGGGVKQGIDNTWHSHASIPQNHHRPAAPAGLRRAAR
jgi:phospholipase C